MRVIKLYEEFNNEEEIDYICNKYGIQDYTINKDGTIDVDGDVYFNNQDLYKLPLKFNKVSGHFHCSECSLISLEGCPKEVGEYFDCSYNQLTSLIGGPNEVGSAYYCYSNHLTSLKGCPSNIGGGFNCNHNQLTSLEGAPKKVIGDFDCVYNKLMSLRGCPLSIGGDFYCNGNPVYEIWKLIYEEEYLELFLDYDMIEGDELNLLKLNDILKMIGKKPVKSVKGYKCI